LIGRWLVTRPAVLVPVPVGCEYHVEYQAEGTVAKLAFLLLRMDLVAQWEIRQYAEAVGQLVAERFPRTWKLFDAQRAKGGQ
jgi:hypothetical protein